MHNCRALGKSPSFAHIYKFRQRVGHLHVHLSDDFALLDLIRKALWVTKNCEFHGAEPGFLERGFIYIKVWGSLC